MIGYLLCNAYSRLSRMHLTLVDKSALSMSNQNTVLHKIKDSCKLLLYAWYLDDGIVIGDSEEVARVLDIIKVSVPGFVRVISSGDNSEAFTVLKASWWEALHDPQSELLLLRSCMGISKLFFGLRTCQPVHMEEATLFFDKGLRGSIENIVPSRAQSWVLQDHILRNSGICNMDDDYVSALACLRETIPSFDFSGFTNKDTVPSKGQ
ncbi:hypothetical protein Tco_0901741 [Tanacetum coccineum]